MKLYGVEYAGRVQLLHDWLVRILALPEPASAEPLLPENERDRHVLKKSAASTRSARGGS